VDVHFYHGWGCDNSIWERVIDRLPVGVRVHNHDRGYFQHEMLSTDTLRPNHALIDQPYVIVTHSMGFLTVPEHLLSMASRLVVVNGFISFCSNNPDYRKGVESVLGAMILRTRRNPAMQINEFRKNAGFEDELLPQYYNIDRLSADLEILKLQRVNVDAVNQIKDVVFISDKNDSIVSSILQCELMDAFSYRDHIFVTETKHLTPLRVPELVVQRILGE